MYSKSYTSEHLGIALDPQLRGQSHVDTRIRRARGAFFGLAPAGIFNRFLSPFDKAFLWRSVVVPSLTFGCDVAPLRPRDVERLDACQSSSVKAALRLPQSARHSALLKALNIPRVQQILRANVLRTLSSCFRSDHRLRQAIIRGLARAVIRPREFDGSFIGQVMDVCNNSLGNLFDASSGTIPKSLIAPPNPKDGVVDSIRTACGYDEPIRTIVLRLLCRVDF